MWAQTSTRTRISCIGLPFRSLHLISGTGWALGVFSSTMSSLQRTTVLNYHLWSIAEVVSNCWHHRSEVNIISWGPVSRGWQGTKLSGARAAACVCSYFGGCSVCHTTMYPNLNTIAVDIQNLFFFLTAFKIKRCYSKFLSSSNIIIQLFFF